ncbi:MAG TPA: hypothetical protein VHT27_08005 [Solirubrobacteraceae bacterium]|nr:hypothetical protein [Solirubrobacteraceae bacterium]
MSFLATAVLYPCALAALALGAGLLVDRAAGGTLAPALLLSAGVAALIALSQLLTFMSPLAPATPWAMLALALAGLLACPGRLRMLAGAAARRPLLVAGPVVAYALALAPVLVAGRTTFSSFMALADSAVHMMGADYLIHHGQSYGGLDVHNSYGRFISDYYGTSYPSGADTLFGGSATLLGLPLIWAFQPFNAFILASAFGPAWQLARRVGLSGALAWAAALCAVVPALVYGYDLLGSVKEITALAMMLAAGALVADHDRWLGGPARRSLPFALVLAAGVSALGPAFGAWGIAAIVVLLGAVALGRPAAARRRVAAQAAFAAVAGAIAALPTIAGLGASLKVASAIASTSNPGNLHTPLRATQVFGVWLGDSYKAQPAGGSLTLTRLLIGLTAAAALAGAAWLLRARSYALAAWIALTLVCWGVVSVAVTTWAGAKTLMITSPVVVLLAWAGVAALAGKRRAPARVAAAFALAAALLAGVLISDELQYRSANLAPTARYEELASVGHRFAGQGPALFTDFDEYAMYELRRLDIGGPDFVYPPPALASLASGYGQPVALERAPPAALAAYPLVVTRRDPLQSRPPAAYELAWQGDYYEVWKRRRAAPASAGTVTLAGSAAQQCARIAALVRSSPGASALAAAPAPRVVAVSLAASRHPRRWGHERLGLVMGVPGTLRARFSVPSAGAWEVWVQGQLMPTVTLAIDGHRLASIGGELSGNSLVPDTVPPRTLVLRAGSHTLTIDRGAPTFAPGDRGAAVLDAIFLTPARTQAGLALEQVPLARWHSLCGRSYRWVEAVQPAA